MHSYLIVLLSISVTDSDVSDSDVSSRGNSPLKKAVRVAMEANPRSQQYKEAAAVLQKRNQRKTKLIERIISEDESKCGVWKLLIAMSINILKNSFSFG